MQRRTFLKGAAALGLAAGTSTERAMAAVAKTADEGAPLPDKIAAALARFREAIPTNFDSAYVENAVVPFFLTSFYEGERPLLPMIDLNFSKENALRLIFGGCSTRTGNRLLRKA
jgi:hypothetical protein